MSRVTYLKEIIINDDVSIYTILYELYQDMYHKREWAGENGSHPFTGDVTSIFEPHAKEGKSLENREIVIAAAGGNMTYDESYNLLDGMGDIEASTDIYNAIKEAYPSATRVGGVDANGDPTTTMSGPLTLHTDHFSRPYNVDDYFNGWTIVAKNAGQTGTGIISDFNSSDGAIVVAWDVVVTTDTNTKYTMLPPSHVWWTCPPADIIIDRYNLFKREMAIEVLKQQRDAILSETEKYINPDYPHKYKSKKDSWKTYRQSIRNLTEQVETLSKPAWSNHSRNWGDDIPFDVDMKTFDPTKGTLRLKSKQESRHATSASKLENDSNFWTSNDTFGGWKKTVNGVEENITSGFNLTKPDETDDSGEDGKNIFIVTVDDKTTNHPIQGDSSYAFLIDDVEGDFLKLTPGTYQFDQSHYSNKGYKIKLFIGGGDTLTEFTDNVSYNGNAGDTGAYLQVVITEMTPFSLQYHHEMHTSLNNVKNMGGYIHVGGTRMPPPLLGLNIDSGSTGNTNLTIKSSNEADGEAHLTMISDNHEHEGDGFQLKVVNGILTLSSDHTKKETYDKTILTITGHATDTSILTEITGDLTVSGTVDATIGATTPAAGTFTTLTANDQLVVNAGATITSDTIDEITLAVKGVDSQTANLLTIGLSDNTDKLTVSNAGTTTAASLVIGNGDTSYTLPTTRADASNKVLTSDASGGVTWETPSGGGGGGVISSVDNFADNRIVTAVGSDGLYGESGLTFNSSWVGNCLDSISDSDDVGLQLRINGFTRMEIDKLKIEMSAITEIDSATLWPSIAYSASTGAATLRDPEYAPLRLIRGPSRTDMKTPDETMVALALRSRLNTPNSVNSSTWPYAKKDYGVGLDFEVETGRFAQYTPDIKIGARIETVLISDAASGNHSNPPEVGEGFDLVFNTMSGGAPATEALRIHDNGNLTLKGDIILDGGGSITGGGEAAITINASGEVTKIGQDVPSDGQVLTWDDDNNKVVWETVSGGGGLPSGLAYNNVTFSVIGNITASQDITAYQGSDRRFKDNLVRISEPNEKIKKINGYEFDWNEKHELYKNTHDVGVVAQEIEEVLPEIVIEREDGYKAVKYEKIISLLIESNKDLLKRVEELEKVKK